jgi:predicted small lipoprotein YifL
MKKFVSVLLAVLLVGSVFAGCGKKAAENTPTNTHHLHQLKRQRLKQQLKLVWQQMKAEKVINHSTIQLLQVLTK